MISPILLIAIPLLIAFLSIIFKKIEKSFLRLAIIANLVCLFLIEKGDYFIGGFKPPFGINLVLDDYSLLGVIVINVAFAISIMISSNSIGKYSTVLLISLAGLNGMILTGDLFNLFVFLEIGAIAAYVLSSMAKKYKYSFNYLIIGTLGSGLYLFGIIILYSIFGSLNMGDIANKVALSSINPKVILLPVMLIFTGLAVEAKLLPFNGWVKGVLGNANGLVGSIFAASYSGAILIVIGRIFNDVLIIPDNLRTVFVVIGVSTLILGELAAFSKNNLRDILLFSSIAQSGLAVTLFIYNLSFLGIIVVLSNVASKVVMFSIAGNIYEDTGTDNLDELGGIFSKYKLVGFGFTIAGMSIIGLPLFYGFFVKINVLVSLFKLNNLWLPALILLVSIVEGAYYIRILVKLWNSGDEGIVSDSKYNTDKSLNNPVKLGLISILVGAFLIVSGIFPDVAFEKAKIASDSLDNAIPSYNFHLTGGMN